VLPLNEHRRTRGARVSACDEPRRGGGGSPLERARAVVGRRAHHARREMRNPAQTGQAMPVRDRIDRIVDPGTLAEGGAASEMGRRATVRTRTGCGVVTGMAKVGGPPPSA